jgi:hypothetical protein
VNISDDDCRDLIDLLTEVRRRGVDNRLIWSKASDVFESSITHRQALLLGGAWSPQFFREADDSLDTVPLMRRLSFPRIVVAEKATEKLAEWLPLMEAIAQAGESLLLVTKEISTEMLHTLIVNSAKGTLNNAVIHLEREGTPDVLGKVWSSPPTSTERLVRASEAWVRRTGTAVLPPAGEQWKGMEDLEIIAAGGESLHHQRDRMRYLMKAIQAPVRRF